jgi:hypothetical protein
MDWSDHGTGTEGLTAAVTKLENGVLARTRKLETLDRALMRLLPRRVAAAMEVGVQDCYLNGCACGPFHFDCYWRLHCYGSNQCTQDLCATNRWINCPD